jgi:hypothetical protein
MPRQYQHIRASELRRGKSEKEAKRIAAATWNKLHPSNPNPWRHEKRKRKLGPGSKRLMPRRDARGFY